MIRKLFGFEPARRTFEIVSGPLVRLVSVIVFGVENVPAWWGRLNGTGPGLKTTADGVPVPWSCTVCCPLLASELSWSTASAAPGTVGANVTVIVHWPFGRERRGCLARVADRELRGVRPASVGAAMCMYSFPLFVTVTVWVADDVKTGWFPNEIDAGDTSATAASAAAGELDVLPLDGQRAVLRPDRVRRERRRGSSSSCPRRRLAAAIRALTL